MAVLFQEAFDHSGRTLNIIVSPKNNLTDPPRLLNYLTAPHVLVWSAVVCSCSVPGLFGAFSLLVSARIIFSCACFFACALCMILTSTLHCIYFAFFHLFIFILIALYVNWLCVANFMLVPTVILSTTHSRSFLTSCTACHG